MAATLQDIQKRAGLRHEPPAALPDLERRAGTRRPASRPAHETPVNKGNRLHEAGPADAAVAKAAPARDDRTAGRIDDLERRVGGLTETLCNQAFWVQKDRGRDAADEAVGFSWSDFVTYVMEAD